jgi:hypothetical protein
VKAGVFLYKVSQGKSLRSLLRKQAKAKRAGDMAQVAGCLPSKHKVLSSNPSTERLKKKKKQKTMHYDFIGNGTNT